jgi:hypothetical protein
VPVILTNMQLDAPVVVRLASGINVRLAPAETSQPLPEAEVVHSPDVDKLRARGVIDVTDQNTSVGGQAATVADPGRESES